MTVEEYLKTNKAVNISEVAKIMFPNNKTASLYLTNKLNKTAKRTFTKKDAESALKALKELYGNINELTIE
jgi:DNA-directed RNA polymerase subunit F